MGFSSLIISNITVLIFLFILVAFLLVAYIMSNKPLGIEINPLVKSEISSEHDHPLLSSGQEKTLQSLGVNLESISTTITPAQEQCAIETLGQDRVNQIKSGSDPSVIDYFKAKECF